MSKFLDELLAARSSGPHAPHEIDRSVIEQGGELARLRAIVGALCNLLIERDIVDRGELIERLRDALHAIDPLMLPTIRRVTPPTGPILSAGANPYRDEASATASAEARVACIRCGRVVPHQHTNLTTEGPICDTCWEPRI